MGDIRALEMRPFPYLERVPPPTGLAIGLAAPRSNIAIED
jgi:hypothetical protein